MFRRYSESDYDELLRLRCLLYADYSEEDMRAELDAFLHHPRSNAYRNYDSWTSFVYQRETGQLGGFIDVGLVCADDYRQRLTHFSGSAYYAQIDELLQRGRPIPLVESWYVDADARGRRIGTGLMQRAEQWVAERGYPFILSDTDDFRELSKRAHASLGFVNYHVDADGCHYYYKRVDGC